MHLFFYIFVNKVNINTHYNMVTLNIGNTADVLILTLKEKSNVTNPVYNIRFTNVMTKDVVSYVLGEDLSLFKDRYNKFIINTSSLFSTKQLGQWNYVVEETPSNLVVEVGKMILVKDTEFSFDAYSTSTTFKGYEG